MRVRRTIVRALGLALFRTGLILAGSVTLCWPLPPGALRGIVGAAWGLFCGLFWLWQDRHTWRPRP